MNTHLFEAEEPKKRRFGCLHVLGIVLIVMVVTALLTAWWIKSNIYAARIETPVLNAEEQQVLDSKLAKLTEPAGQEAVSTDAAPAKAEFATKPGEFSDDEEFKYELTISEKELNAMIADEPELAGHVKVDFGEDSISLTVLIPVDEEMFLVGGTTIRLRVDVTLRYEDQKPVFAFHHISVGGIPIPGAWLGDLKDVNLAEAFDEEGGFWDQFAAGIADIKVQDGQLWVKLREESLHIETGTE